MEHFFSLEERIQHVLMMQSKFLSDFGLFHGRMGVAITFAHLYRHTRNEMYDDCMNEMLDDILKKTYKGLDIGFEYGFSGIGWGLEYLLQNHFVGGKGTIVCEALDRKIMEKDPRRITDLSLETGLEGLLHYILAHLNGAILNGVQFPFDDRYLNDLDEAVRLVPLGDVQPSLVSLIDIYKGWHGKKDTLNYQFNIGKFIKPVKIEDGRLSEYSLGIREGCSGNLLKSLLQ